MNRLYETSKLYNLKKQKWLMNSLFDGRQTYVLKTRILEAQSNFKKTLETHPLKDEGTKL